MEVIELESPTSLPAVSHPERDARNAITKWLAGFRSENTRRAYAKELEAFAAFARQPDVKAAAAWLLGLSEFQAHNAVDLWRADKIARGNKPATVNRSMAALNSFVTSARRGGFTALRLEALGEKSVPYRDTKGPGLPAYLTMLVVARNQTDRMKSARDVAILMLAFGLALRRAEIAAIDISDVDLDGSRLAVMGKGRAEPVFLTLTAELKDVLAAWLHYRRASGPAAPLFVSVSRAAKDGRLTGDGIYKIIRDDIGGMAGVKARPHGLRHTAITEALNRVGGDFRKVRSFSRHSSLDIIRVYDDAREDFAGQVSQILTSLTA